LVIIAHQKPIYYKMKNLLLLVILTLFVACSSSIDTSNMAPEDRLAYAVKLYQQEDYEEAIKELDAIILQYPGSSIMDDAQYYLAMTRFQRKEYILAAYQFSKLIKSMPSSEFLADAQYMLADCYYELSPNFALDQQYSKKAIEEFQVFIDVFPLNEKVAQAETKINELNDKLAKKEFESARIYGKMEYYDAALKYYDSVVEIYHDTQYAPLALYNKINLLIDRNKESEALLEAQKFISKYPQHTYFSDVEKIKNSLESKFSANP
jgi:outer membrane protein assembly factor BamD